MYIFLSLFKRTYFVQFHWYHPIQCEKNWKEGKKELNRSTREAAEAPSRRKDNARMRARIVVGQRAQVSAQRAIYARREHRGRFSSGKPTIRPVLKRNVAAVTRPFVLQRVGGRRTAGYNILSRTGRTGREKGECLVRERRETNLTVGTSEKERERWRREAAK